MPCVDWTMVEREGKEGYLGENEEFMRRASGGGWGRVGLEQRHWGGGGLLLT